MSPFYKARELKNGFYVLKGLLKKKEKKMQLRPYVATNAKMFTILPFTELAFLVS